MSGFIIPLYDKSFYLRLPKMKSKQLKLSDLNLELNNVSVHNDGTCLILIEKKRIDLAKDNNKLQKLFDINNLHVDIED